MFCPFLGGYTDGYLPYPLWLEHVSEHHIHIQNYKCTCGTEFATMWKIVTHMIEKHTIKGFACPCGYKSTFLVETETHMKECKEMNEEKCIRCEMVQCFCYNDE